MVELGLVEQRYQAVLQVRGGVSVTEVAGRCGVARPTLHRWLRRYASRGLVGLVEGSTVPGSCPHQMPAEVEARVVELRRENPGWGPRTIRHRLERDGVVPLPGRSSIYRCQPGATQHPCLRGSGSPQGARGTHPSGSMNRGRRCLTGGLGLRSTSARRSSSTPTPTKPAVPASAVGDLNLSGVVPYTRVALPTKSSKDVVPSCGRNGLVPHAYQTLRAPRARVPRILMAERRVVGHPHNARAVRNDVRCHRWPSGRSVHAVLALLIHTPSES